MMNFTMRLLRKVLPWRMRAKLQAWDMARVNKKKKARRDAAGR
jgi:hypothetical protein